MQSTMQCRLTVLVALASMCMVQHSMGLTVEKSQRATLEMQMGIGEVATRFLSSDSDEQDKMLQDPYVLQAIWRHMNEEEPQMEPVHVVMVEAPEGEANQGDASPAAPVGGVNLRDLARAMAMKVLKATKEKMEAERAAHHAAKHKSDAEAEAAASQAKAKAEELKDMAHKAALEMGRAARAVEGAHSNVVANTVEWKKKESTPVVSSSESETATCNQRLAEVENRLVAAEDRLKRVRAAVVVDFDTTVEPTVAAPAQTTPQRFSTSLEPPATTGRSTTVQDVPMPVSQDAEGVAAGMADEKDLEMEEKELNAEDQKLHHIRLQEVDQEDE